ncbi:MAG TPA: aldehyde dehydrogenase family protein [Burkholderiaceae bacterium]|nr:aldehyde dehydrogenase family protein [Burkholderiaceae bacterium]HQR72107.1 aldehyde dehydrogenase family protein [Burkholderiaceae bacterium]
MLNIINPANGRVIAELPDDTAETVAAAYQRARAAQPGWASQPLPARIEAIRRFRAELVRETERLAAILTSEVGKPIRQSRNEINGLLGRIDFFLAESERTLAPRQVFDEGGMREQITHEPLGVVANISAWNYPYFVGANVFVPALITGNTVLYKPSEFATLTGLEIGKLLHVSGIPQPAFQVLVGAGAVGAALLAQPVDGVFFTGSYATGAKIAQAVGPRMIKLQLELGGKDPTYVCEDVDAAAAAASLADGAMYNTGQSCCSVERIYVHASIHDAFVAAFVKEVRGFTISDPTDEAAYIGPLTRAPQLEVLERQVADAKAKGAKLLVGGQRLDGPGNWFAPTVFSGVDHSMALMREESFGPVIGIQKVADDAEAVRLMNDTEYGLTAGVYTRDEARARRILAQVHAGSVYWNCCDRVSPRLPWSGVGHSGVGLTLSTYGIETFTRPKAWHLRGA